MKCPILPNWMMNKHGECKRFEFCDDARLAICGAKSISDHTPTPYSAPGKECPHKHTTLKPTKDKVFVDGEQKMVFDVICKECGFVRKLMI